MRRPLSVGCGLQGLKSCLFSRTGGLASSVVCVTAPMMMVMMMTTKTTWKCKCVRRWTGFLESTWPFAVLLDASGAH